MLKPLKPAPKPRTPNTLMPRPGEIVYAITSKGDLEPVRIKRTQDVPRATPDGEEFPDTIWTVENGKHREYSKFSYDFQFVPFIPAIEAEQAASVR
jgi:hypothetical protein